MELLQQLLERARGVAERQPAKIGLAAATVVAVVAIYQLARPSPLPEPVAEVVVLHRQRANAEEQPASKAKATADAAARVTGAGDAPTSAGSLTRALQWGLRRANCYDGPVTGQWSRQSQEAMGRFVAAVNAQLPVDRPDSVLLALVDANPNASCGAGRLQAAAAAVPSAPAPSTRMEPSAVIQQPPVWRQMPAAPAPRADTIDSTVAVTAGDATTSRAPDARQDLAPAPVPRDPPRFAPFALAPPAAPAALPAEAAPERERVVRAPRHLRRAYMPPRRTIVRYRPRTTADGVARSVSRNMRALQRTLGMIVYY